MRELERKLAKYERRHRIGNDEELIRAIYDLISKEERKLRLFRNYRLIEEATDALIDLCGAGDGIENEIERCREALSVSLVNEERRAGGRAAPILKFLIPAAILLSLFLALTSSAHEFRYLANRMTLKERRIIDNMQEGETRIEGDNEYKVSKHGTYTRIESLKQLNDLIDVPGVLLPFGVEDKYEMSLDYADFVTFKRGDIIIDQNGSYAHIIVETRENYVNVKDERKRIGDFEVLASEYEDLMRPGYMTYQFEFDFEGNSYSIRSISYELSLEILYSLEEMKE